MMIQTAYVPCNLCGVDDTREVALYGDVRIVRCDSCGLVYRNPRLDERMNREFHSMGRYGDYEGIETYVSGARLKVFDDVLRVLEPRTLDGSRRLLDVGCGQGHFLNLAKRCGWEVAGVELAASACEYARQKFGIDVINKAIEEAHFEDESFDVITLWNVLDHLLDPLGMLKEIRRVLKTDGILVIRVPNVGFHLFAHRIFSLLPQGSAAQTLRDPSVVVNYGFSAETMRRLLKRAGYRYMQVRNSPPSEGDPYGSFGRSGAWIARAAKGAAYMSAQCAFGLSLGRMVIGPSLLVVGKKTV